jgi:hypothetical protein
MSTPTDPEDILELLDPAGYFDDGGDVDDVAPGSKGHIGPASVASLARTMGEIYARRKLSATVEINSGDLVYVRWPWEMGIVEKVNDLAYGREYQVYLESGTTVSKTREGIVPA